MRDVRVVEVGSIGPGPFAAMLLADLGRRRDPAGPLSSGAASGVLAPGPWNVLHRGRPSVGIDLKRPEARELVLRLCESADVLVEGFRPGVMERLGLGPADVHERRPQLVYGRMTGYGQDGPMAAAAGHDINYIATAGILGAHRPSRRTPAVPPQSPRGLRRRRHAAGLRRRVRPARGRAPRVMARSSTPPWSMGAPLLATLVYGLRAGGFWTDEPGSNFLDSGAHFYEVYTAADGGHIAVGALEPQFYAALLEVLEIPPAEAPQWDEERWPELKQRLAEVFATRTRDEWAALFADVDACTTPVYTMAEAPQQAHMAARGTFVEVDGVLQPAPAPRFSRTPGAITRSAPDPGADTEPALTSWGIGAEEIAALRSAGAVG